MTVMSNWFIRGGLAALLLPIATPALAQDAGPAADDSVGVNGWPREIVTADYKIIIYQPQPETFEGNRVTYRAAVSADLLVNGTAHAILLNVSITVNKYEVCRLALLRYFIISARSACHRSMGCLLTMGLVTFWRRIG